MIYFFQIFLKFLLLAQKMKVLILFSYWICSKL